MAYLRSSSVISPLLVLVVVLPHRSADAQTGGRLPTGPAQPPKVATLDIFVPAEAELWFDNYKSSQTGAIRSFVTPPLPHGQEYAYQLRMRRSGGEWSCVLTIRAGEHKNITLPIKQSATSLSRDAK
jgi:uncharacterized protein (TIGR03000 family)